jgi:two-component system response regulator YesN
MRSLYLADDELIILRGLKKLLDWEALGLSIIGEATNGKQAEEDLRRLRPDLAILDIRMPLKTGLEILHTIKAENLPTAVIFLSGHDEFAYAQDALRHGALNYLLKPVRKEELLEALREALNRAGGEKSFIDSLLEKQDSEQTRRFLLYIKEHYAENLSLERVARLAYRTPAIAASISRSTSA